MRSSPRPSLEGRPPVSVRSLATITLTCIASCASAGDALYVAGFDDVDALTEYESIGVTFGGTISLWFGGGCSVYQDPCCGPASVPNGICAGSCGGTTGIITFAEPQSIIFITALSGPGCDLLNDGTRIEAADLVRELNVAMTWLSYPGRSTTTARAEAVDLGALAGAN